MKSTAFAVLCFRCALAKSEIRRDNVDRFHKGVLPYKKETYGTKQTKFAEDKNPRISEKPLLFIISVPSKSNLYESVAATMQTAAATKIDSIKTQAITLFTLHRSVLSFQDLLYTRDYSASVFGGGNVSFFPSCIFAKFVYLLGKGRKCRRNVQTFKA